MLPRLPREQTKEVHKLAFTGVKYGRSRLLSDSGRISGRQCRGLREFLPFTTRSLSLYLPRIIQLIGSDFFEIDFRLFFVYIRDQSCTTYTRLVKMPAQGVDVTELLARIQQIGSSNFQDDHLAKGKLLNALSVLQREIEGPAAYLSRVRQAVCPHESVRLPY